MSQGEASSCSTHAKMAVQRTMKEVCTGEDKLAISGGSDSHLCSMKQDTGNGSAGLEPTFVGTSSLYIVVQQELAIRAHV